MRTVEATPYLLKIHIEIDFHILKQIILFLFYVSAYLTLNYYVLILLMGFDRFAAHNPKTFGQQLPPNNLNSRFGNPMPMRPPSNEHDRKISFTASSVGMGQPFTQNAMFNSNYVGPMNGMY